MIVILMMNSVTAALREGANGVMVGRAAYNNPWNTLGHVDSEVYGASCSNLPRRQILENYQMYGDSELGKYGPNKPSVRQMVKTIKSFLEETLDAIPDNVLDSTLLKNPSIGEGGFAGINSLPPPPYRSCEKQALSIIGA
ncbi:unnamed protein product [Musa hybrid cultivar]